MKVVSGASHCAVLSTSGAVLTWGSNLKSQLGVPAQSHTLHTLPTGLRGLLRARAYDLSCGYEHTVVCCDVRVEGSSGMDT